jgi:probable O-glycosylation ligase (exosortase A-associated)
MSIRDIVVTVAVIGCLPACFFRPWVGILVWSWLAFMNAPQLAWGFAQTVPWALMVAVATLAGFLVTKERKPFIINRESLLIVALWIWVSLTTLTALYPEPAFQGWERFSKILLMALLTIPLFQDRARLRLLLIVTALSVGFYGLKGGIWAIVTGGENKVYGPPGNTFLSDNTSVALALNMCIPVLLYLAKEEPRRWLRWGLYATFGFSIVAVPFTYSRGGFLGLIAVLALLFLKARTRFLLIPLVVAAVFAFAWFAPDKFTHRMDTIWNYEHEGSAQARFISWRVAYALALDNPFFGGGFWSIAQRQTFLNYAPDYPYGGGSHDSHSIYFNVLGEHGFIGFGLFVALIVCVLLTLHRLRNLHRRAPDLGWISNYAHMLQVSIVAYLVCGVFLSLAYFDLPYHMFVVIVILKHLADRELAALPAPVPAPLAPVPLPRMG